MGLYGVHKRHHRFARLWLYSPNQAALSIWIDAACSTVTTIAVALKLHVVLDSYLLHVDFTTQCPAIPRLDITTADVDAA